ASSDAGAPASSSDATDAQICPGLRAPHHAVRIDPGASSFAAARRRLADLAPQGQDRLREGRAEGRVAVGRRSAASLAEARSAVLDVAALRLRPGAGRARD